MNRPGSRKRDWSSLIPVIGFLVLTLLFFYRVLIANRVLLASDFILSYNIFIKFALDYFHEHQTIPFWLPYIYGGMPMVECLLVPFFYPPFWLLFFLPFAIAMNLQYLIHIFLAGFFTYLLARELGISRLAAFFSGVAFMFSGSVLTILAAGHFMKVYTYGLYPLLFLLVYKGLNSKRLFHFVAAGGVIGLLLLSMHMQVIFYGLMLLSFFVAYWLIKDFIRDRDYTKFLTGGVHYLVMISLGLSIGMAQFYPAFDYMGYSTRQKGVSYEFATSWSLPPEDLAGLFAPGSSGEQGGYFGRIPFMDRNHYTSVIPLVFALIAVFFVRRREVSFFTFGALFILTISLGGYTPIYKLYYYLIPGINKFRLPMSSMYLYAFFQALLAGLGLDYLAKRENPFWRKSGIQVLGALFLTILLAVGLYLFQVPLADYLVRLAAVSPTMKYKWVDQIMALANLKFTLKALLYLGGVLLLVGGGLFSQHFTPRKRLIFFGALLIADLFIVNSKYLKPARPDNQYYKEGYIWQYLKQDKDLFRVHRIGLYRLPRRLGAGNVAVYHKIYSTNGYYQNPIGRFYDIEDYDDGVLNQSVNFMALSNVKYVISSSPLRNDYLTQLRAPANIYFYQNRFFLPRYFLTHAFQVRENPQDIINEIMELRPEEVASLVYLEEEPDFTPRSSSAPGQETVKIVEYQANRIILEVKLESPGFLTMSEVYSPAWEATVDGVPQKILRANYFMRALPLPAGQHKVVMRYNAGAVKIGLSITFIGALVCLLALYFLRIKQKT